MAMTFGLRSSTSSLSACHCSSPQSSACCAAADVAGRRLRGSPRLEDAALRRAAERDALDARARAGQRPAAAQRRRRRRWCGGAPRRSRARRSRRTPDPRCTRASARPTCRRRACASARAGTCRAASSATPAAWPPVRAACRTAARPRAARRRSQTGRQGARTRQARMLAATCPHDSRHAAELPRLRRPTRLELPIEAPSELSA